MSDGTMLFEAPPGEAGMKNTSADEVVADGAHRVTARELRQFVERYERLEAERKDLGELMKDVMAEARARGYDVKCLKKVVALRKRDSAEVSEEEAIVDLYKSSLGM